MIRKYKQQCCEFNLINLKKKKQKCYTKLLCGSGSLKRCYTNRFSIKLKMLAYNTDVL